MDRIDIIDNLYRITLCQKQAEALKVALTFVGDVLLCRYLRTMPGIDDANHDAFMRIIRAAQLPVDERDISSVNNKLLKSERLIGNRWGMVVTASEVMALSYVFEVYARLWLKQYDFASTLSFDAAQEVESLLLEGTLRDTQNRVHKRIHQLELDKGFRHSQAFHAHRVLRHRLSWDMAGNPGERDWSCMMGVSFDDPLTSSYNPQLEGVITISKVHPVV